jgi:hypothetical protein
MRNPYANLPAAMQPFANVSPRLVKTYELRASLSTHWRLATCAEIDCQPHQHGWATTVTADSDDETTLLRTAAGTLDGHRRRFVKQPEAGGFVRYVFPSGQPCFEATAHRVPLEREPIYVVRGGDSWRRIGDFGRRHVRAVDWVDDFATHQSGVADRAARG